MATKKLRLSRGAKDGYWRTTWVDDTGTRRYKRFGRSRDEAIERFDAFKAEWEHDADLRAGRRALTVREAWGVYDARNRRHYRQPDGRPTGEADNIAGAVRELLALFGATPAKAIGAKELAAVRDAMIASDLCRNEINKRCSKIRSMFKWLAGHECGGVSASAHHAMACLEPLRRGRVEGVAESEPVRPVPEAAVWAAVEAMPPIVAAMVVVQYWTGMRPGELVIMRPCDLDTGGPTWVYTPPLHKTQHRGRDRKIPLGPKARAAVGPLLRRAVGAYVFSPREVITAAHAARETHRHQPVEPPRTARRVGERYTVGTYRQAVRRACDRAGVDPWTPGQLRHNAATRLRSAFGVDAAAVVLGHADAGTTLVYAEADLAKAAEAMERAG